MHTLFGITLVLYLLKLSAGKGFWKNLRNADEPSHKIAVIYERVCKKLQAAEYALKFLIQCRDEDISHAGKTSESLVLAKRGNVTRKSSLTKSTTSTS